MYLSFKYSWREIAEIIGRDYQTVLEWVKLYNKYGLKGLILGKPPGKSSTLSNEQLNEIKNIVQINPRKLSLPFSNWSLKLLIKWIKDRFGLIFSREGIRKVLHKLGFRYGKPSYIFILANKQEQKKFIRKLRRKLKQGKTILFCDESIAEQHPTLHRMWMLNRVKIPTLGNHAKSKLFGAVNPFSGNVLWRITKRLTAQEFICFLEMLKTHYSGRKILLCIDNFATHKAHEVRKYIKDNSNWLEILYLPAYSPQFNPIEQLWKYMKYCVTHNTFYYTIEELTIAIENFFTNLKNIKHTVKSICSVDYLVDGG
jgi:transposase